jgi:hypothetical protein
MQVTDAVMEICQYMRTGSYLPRGGYPGGRGEISGAVRLSLVEQVTSTYIDVLERPEIAAAVPFYLATEPRLEARANLAVASRDWR